MVVQLSIQVTGTVLLERYEIYHLGITFLVSLLQYRTVLQYLQDAMHEAFQERAVEHTVTLDVSLHSTVQYPCAALGFHCAAPP